MGMRPQFPPTRFVQLLSHDHDLYALDVEGAVWHRTSEYLGDGPTGAQRRTVWAQVEWPRLPWPRT